MDREQVRQKFVQRAERILRRADQPRFQMSVIVLVTGGVGFIASYLLLNAGVDRMAIRYPLAIVIAYLAFLGLLRLWLYYQRERLTRELDFVDTSGVDGDVSVGGGASATEPFSGASGQFGGGGATDSFETAGEPVSTSLTNVSGGHGSGSSGSGFSFDLDLEELGLVLLAIALVLGAALAGLYIIYVAPGLLAEIFVDGALVTGLYKRLKKEDAQNWLTTAVKRTWLPAGGLALFCAGAGYLIQKLAPTAKSIGVLFH